jgi:L-alanine-DL-glutamate epimerase-like enolase superfamily enzyme
MTVCETPGMCVRRRVRVLLEVAKRDGHEGFGEVHP